MTTNAKASQMIDSYLSFLEKGQRAGQAFLNAAFLTYPDETLAVLAREIDPFYDDSKIDDFVKALYEEMA